MYGIMYADETPILESVFNALQPDATSITDIAGITTLPYTYSELRDMVTDGLITGQDI